ncbi:alkaline phosphatase family protein [Georgenia sp. AZ-5]|uniref:alkaline phosphatase family protein n=1 Tax=Georgenia sp. AZ-5 TaxID=3367526 RepID=UPI0037541D2A
MGTTRTRRAGAVLTTAALAAAGLVTALAPAAATTAETTTDEPKVVFFAIDGFDAEYLDGRVELPNIEALARRGALTTGTGVMASVTNQSWSSAATGAYPEQHLNAAYYYDPAAGTVRGQSRAIAGETLGEALAAAGKTVASVQWFILQNRGVTYGDPDALYTQPGGTCDKRADDAVAILEGRPVSSGGTRVTVPEVPDFLAMYCDDLDSTGHASGDASEDILDALVRVDEQVGRVVQATKRAGTYWRTTFLLSGDHGITSYDHVNGPQTEAALDAAGFQAEWVSTNRRPSAETNVVLAGGGLTSVHLIGDLAGDASALPRVEEVLAGVEGIGSIYDRAEQAAMHMAPAYGNLVVEPQPGWAMFDADAEHTRGRHGTTQELSIAFLIAGSGVRPGAAPANPRLVDITPTVAHMLGVDSPAGVQGRVLTEALVPARD